MPVAHFEGELWAQPLYSLTRCAQTRLSSFPSLGCNAHSNPKMPFPPSRTSSSTPQVSAEPLLSLGHLLRHPRSTAPMTPRMSLVQRLHPHSALIYSLRASTTVGAGNTATDKRQPSGSLYSRERNRQNKHITLSWTVIL